MIQRMPVVMNENSNSPLFSVVIPAYNRAKIISRAIDSVLAQTFTNFEIIIVDDGSSDDLKRVCDEYNSPKIHYFYQDNAGSNPARNTGITNSCGYYISFLDSDDTWEPEYLYEVAQKFANDNELGFVWVKNIRKYLPEGIIQIKKSKKLEGFVYRDILKQGFLINSSCITAKRSLLEMVNGWDNNLLACQDDDICFRLAKITKIGCIDKFLSTFYIDKQLDRISTSNSRRAWNSLFLWQKFAGDVISFCGRKEFEKKIIHVFLLFYKLNDKDGLIHCRKYFLEYLKPSQFEIFIFNIKCMSKIFKFRLKFIIKKILWHLLPIKKIRKKGWF